MKRKSLLLLLLLALGLPWAAKAQTPVPYNEGFENMTSADDLTNAGYITYFEDNSSFVAINTDDHSEGSKSLDMDNWNASDNKYQVVGLPVLNQPINTLQITVSFNIASVGTFSVGYLTDANNANTFVSVADWSDSGWQTQTVELNDVPSGAARIAFKYYRYWRFYVDDIKVRTLPTCFKPKNLQASLTPGDGTIATLTWDRHTIGTENAWVLEYGTTADFTGATSVNVTGGTPSKDLTGLTPEAIYYARVKANCGGGDTSDWSQTLTFNPTNGYGAGTGTSSTGNAPLYTNYKSSYDQMIYTAAQLQAAGITQGTLITKIGFNSAAANTYKRLPTIYMGCTSKSAFDSNTDFVSINNLTMVYSREYSNNTDDPDLWSITAGWNEFELDAPFYYDGTTNLIIAMHCGLASYYYNTYFYATQTDGNQVILAYDDNNDPIPSTYDNNWGGYNGSKMVSNNLPNLRFYVAPIPTKIVASNPNAANGEMTWDEFAGLVNGGVSYAGKTVKLQENISITTTSLDDLVGTSSHPFSGTFDGQQHTLTVDINISGSDDAFQGAAPFSHIQGATIENLVVTGSVQAEAHHAGGLVSKAVGSNENTIRNCLVHTNVTNLNEGVNNHNFIGGIIGQNNVATTNFIGCVYDGTLKSQAFKGGFFGFTNTATITIQDCYFGGSIDTNGLQNASFSPEGCRNGNTSIILTLTLSNFYTNTDLTTYQSDHTNYYPSLGSSSSNHITGVVKHAHTVTAGTNVTVAMSGTPTNYNVSGISAYPVGIVYNGTIIAGDGDQVALTLGYTGSGTLAYYSTSSGTLNGSTLTLANDDAVISAVAAIFSIASKTDWEAFCACVNNGYNYSGKDVTMTADVTDGITTMAGTVLENSNHDPDKAFAGRFDGQGHILNLNLGANQHSTAPFRCLDGATIKNIHVTGTIATNHMRPASIAGYIKGSSTIENCWSEVAISTSHNSDIDGGGFVARVNSDESVTLNGCVFTGSITYSNENGYEGGGMVGWTQDRASAILNNCLFAPSAIDVTKYQGHHMLVGGYTHGTLTNCYYNAVAAESSLTATNQGKQAYTITGTTATVGMSGTATPYGVSGITSYNNGGNLLPGMLYNGTIIAGDGDLVALTLSGGTIYQASAGTLNGNVLTMPASNVEISSIATVPFADNFEGGNNWTFVNGDLTNVWAYGEATNNGTHALYISNDGGVSNAYTINKEATVYAYRVISFESGYYSFSYDWKAKGEGNWDYLRVALVPTSVTLEASTSIPTLPSGYFYNNLPTGWIALDGGGQLRGKDTWQSFATPQDIQIEAGTYMMVFAWRNDGSGGSQPPAAIDNVSIERVSCWTPTNLAYSNVTATGATFTWDAEDNDVFEYCTFKQSHGAPTDSDFNSTTQPGENTISWDNYFEPYTTNIFYLRKKCSEDSHSQYVSVTFTTQRACESLSYSDLTDKTVTLSWTDNAYNITAWQVVLNNDESNLIDVYSNPCTLTGLTPETYYTVKVRAVNSNWAEGHSEWSNSTSFTTLETCVTPTAFAVDETTLTGHTATLTWTGSSDNYNVMYRMVDGIDEDFNTSSSLPSGWEKKDGLLENVMNGTALSNGGSWYIASRYDVFGTDNIHAYNNIYGSSQHDWLISPRFNVGASNNTLSFDLALTDYGNANVIDNLDGQPDDRFIVLITTDDEATWTILREWNNSGSSYVYNTIATAGENVTINLSSYAGQNVRIAFYGESTESNGDNDMHLDNVRIGTLAAWQTVTSNEATKTLTGLTPESSYEAKVQGDCGDDGLSHETATVVFTTLDGCFVPYHLEASDITHNSATLSWTGETDSYNVRYRIADGFDEQFTTTSLPAYWEKKSGLLDNVMNGTALSDGGSWYIASRNDVFGTDNIHACNNIYGSSKHDWLISPRFNVGASNNTLSFDLALTDFGNANVIENLDGQPDDRFIVLITTDDEATWTILREWNNSGSSYVYNTIATAGENVTINLSSYAGQNVRIAFYGESTESNGDNDMHLDNVQIGTPASAATWQTVTSDETSKALTNLLADRRYETQVQGVCENVPTAWSDAYFFTTRKVHTLYVEAPHGVVSVNGDEVTTSTQVMEGGTVALSVAPDEGYSLTAVTYTPAGDEPIDITSSMEFTMPTSNVTVTASFSQIPYDITVTASPNAGGTPVLSTATAHLGDNITVTANAAAGYSVASVTTSPLCEVTNNGDGTYSFAMPASDVAVTVTYAPQLATVTTAEPVHATTTATLGGSWSGGHASVSTCGVEYSTDNFASDVHAVAAMSVNSPFSVNVTGLTPETTYYVRAYVTNAGGTSYGQVESFTTCAYMSVAVSVNPENVGEVEFSVAGTGSGAAPLTPYFVGNQSSTSTTDRHPMNTNNKYTLSEMLYLKDEIGTSGTIKKISFKYAGSDDLSRTVEVYMKEVDQSSFYGLGNNWVQLIASDRRFSGTVTATPSSGWVTITLGNDFVYNGTGNLMVAFYDITGPDHAGARPWITSETSTNTCCSFASDSNFNPYATAIGDLPSAHSGDKARPIIKLEFTTDSGNTQWYECGSSTQITATPTATGYYFVNWTDENNQPVSTANPLTLSDIQEDHNLTANFVNYKRFTTTGNWNVDGNWTPSGVPATTDNVYIEQHATIPSGYTAKVVNISGIAGTGSITIEDGGQLWHSNDNVTMTVNKSITGYGSAYSSTNKGYYLFSSPISPITACSGIHTSTHYDWYYFDCNSDPTEWIYESHNTETVPFFLRGYIYANEVNTTISVTGTANPSEEPFTGNALTYATENAKRFNGWNLVGNPFVCNAYAYGVDDNETLSQLNYYRLNHNIEGYDEFIADYDRNPIAPMSALMVKATASGQKVKYFREAQSVGSKGILNMSVTKANYRGTLDLARIRFGEGEGLPKFQLNPDHTKLYIPMVDEDYAVVYAEPVGEMPVSFKAEENGQYTLTFSAEEVGFSYLHLIDNLMGADVDLLETPYYTFSARTTDYASRFKVVFATSSGADDEPFAFYSNGMWVIANDGDAILQVVDVTGRVLSSDRISGATSKPIHAAPGVYMLRLINGDNVKVQKVVVR